MRKTTSIFQVPVWASATVLGSSLALAQPAPPPEVQGSAPASAGATKTAPARLAPTPTVIPAVQSYRRTRLARKSPAFTLRGRLEAVIDGQFVLSEPVSLSVRRTISHHRQIPLNQVPDRLRRTFLPSASLGIRPILDLEGKDVEVTAYTDAKGFSIASAVTQITTPPPSSP